MDPDCDHDFEASEATFHPERFQAYLRETCADCGGVRVVSMESFDVEAL